MCFVLFKFELGLEHCLDVMNYFCIIKNADVKVFAH